MVLRFAAAPAAPPRALPHPELHPRTSAAPTIEPVSVTNRTHIATVVLEDYFQVSAFSASVGRKRWSWFDARVEQATRRTLEFLDEFGARATFFVLGSVADRVPELMREITDRGHEVASRGYDRVRPRSLRPSAFRDDLARAREVLERATGTAVVGHRTTDWLTADDEWIVDVLAEEGYAYDSSVLPRLTGFSGEMPQYHPYLTDTSSGAPLWEYPVSSVRLGGLAFPFAGGNYLRQMPKALARRAFDRWDRTTDAPLVLYFHTWELDPDQPQLTGVPALARLRHYRNLPGMPARLREHFTRYRFGTIADHLGTAAEAAAAPRLTSQARSNAPELAGPAAASIVVRTTPECPVTPFTIVVPCHNEADTLPYLANALQSLEQSMTASFELRYVFVDDASTDATWATLERTFGTSSRVTLVRHEVNHGVASAILNGIRAATTEVVCSIDCDCSYDPTELRAMIPLLTSDVDCVTASPYHPQGAVRNVPAWRLVMSRSLTGLYRLVLRQRLYTYTSCFRVYRRSAMMNVSLAHGGFLGVAEVIAQLDRRGARIVEHPTLLEARLLGESKMRVARTVVGHIKLLAQLAWERIREPGGAVPAVAGRTVA
jgi:polysaccharide deacetylase family protein (PEP-CTERM system associated)